MGGFSGELGLRGSILICIGREHREGFNVIARERSIIRAVRVMLIMKAIKYVGELLWRKRVNVTTSARIDPVEIITITASQAVLFM